MNQRIEMPVASASGEIAAERVLPPSLLGQTTGLLSGLTAISFDPRAVFATIKRNRWLAAGILLLALLLGILSILLTRPQYKATSSIQIDQQVAKVLGTEDNDQFQIAGDAERFLQTQVDVLKSRDLAERVVDKLKLPRDVKFFDMMGAKSKVSGNVTTAARRELAVDLLQKAISISSPRLSRVVRIEVESYDAVTSSRLANAYAEAYIEGNLQRRFDQSSYSRKFLQDQLEQTRIKLELSERDMINYARQSGVIELTSPTLAGGSGGSSQSLVTSDLAQFNQNLAQARAARIAAEQQWLQARTTPVLSLPEVQTNPAIQTMTQQLAAARVEYRELRERLQEDHPTALQKQSAIVGLERELQRQAAAVRESIHNRYQVAARQETSLSSAVDGLKSASIAERGQSIQSNILKREVETNRAIYDALLQRFKEVSAEAGVTTNNISVIDVAVPPKSADSPRPLLNMGLALLLGLGGAGAAVIGRERLTDAVRTPEDVESRVGLALLGVTPSVPEAKSPLEEFKDPKTQFSEAIHAVRISLELSTANGTPRSLALTSARPSEGKSTLAYSLASEMAKAGRRVALIDADMRAPTQHQLFGLKNKQGLSQVLARQIQLSEVLLPTDQKGLSVITSGPLPPDPTLLLDGVSLSAMIDTLHESFDLVIFDCPPVLGLADALQVGSRVESMIMVIEADDTRLSILKTALKRLQANRVRILGAVLSKFDAKRFGYGEYYGYYYSHYGKDAA